MATNKRTDKPLIKTKPTIFPLGFSVGKVENDLIIVDFIDVIGGETTIVESIAMPQSKAEQLSEALKGTIKDGKAEE